MQIQKLFHNLSDRQNQINFEIKNNSSNSNFEKINKKDTHSDKKEKENDKDEEKQIKENQHDIDEKNKIIIKNEEDINNNPINFPSPPLIYNNMNSNESKEINQTCFDINPNNKNNYINTNDDNFFNISFYNKENNNIININNQ